jgi:hypothetical protein
MTALGQKSKYSERVQEVRFARKSGHPFIMICRHPYFNEGPACDTRFSYTFQAILADIRRESLAGAIVGAAVLNELARHYAITFEAYLAD